jgi:hypothetical protein
LTTESVKSRWIRREVDTRRNAKGESVGNSKKDEAVASATAHFYASLPEPTDAAHECEAGDDAEAVLVERYAEVISERTEIDRREALKIGAAIFEVQRARDAACAGAGVVSPVFVGCAEGAVAVASWMLRVDAEDRLEQALARAREARDSRLALGCLAFARGKPPYGVWSMRKLAELHKVSVEAVSNEVGEFQEILGLPRTNQQKSARAVGVYARTNGARVRETADAK